MRVDEAKLRERVGVAMAEARREAGLTRRGLADAVGTDPSQISRWEHGRVLPRLPWLAEVAAALGCPIGRLLPVEEALEPVPEDGAGPFAGTSES